MKPVDPHSDDERWVDGLAGRADPDGPEATRVEAATLRAALKAREAREVRDDAPVSADLSREAELLARARAEGLLDAPAHPGTPASPAAPAPRRSSPRWLPWLAAAAIAGLAVGLGLQFRSAMPPDATPMLERAGPLSPYRITSDDPLALKRQLLAGLRAAGVDARGYEALGVQGIDADLPRPLPDAVRHLLQSHGIPIPDDGVLQVQIVAREASRSAQ